MRTATRATGTALVMHDDVWVRSQVAATLGEAGYTVLAASNGASGVRLAEQHRPEVIVLGMALPEISGAAVLEQLQGCGATKDIPVLVVSSRVGEDMQSSDPAAGDMSQPVGLGDLLPEVQRAVHQPCPSAAAT